MDDALLAAERCTEALLHTLRVARAMVEAGRVVELRGLVDQVGFVCAKVMDLPPEDGKRIRTRLAVLMTEVDAMAAAMRRQGWNAPAPGPAPGRPALC